MPVGLESVGFWWRSSQRVEYTINGFLVVGRLTHFDNRDGRSFRGTVASWCCHLAGDSVVALRVCLSDIKKVRFLSPARCCWCHGVWYRKNRQKNQKKKIYVSITSSPPLSSTVFSPFCAWLFFLCLLSYPPVQWPLQPHFISTVSRSVLAWVVNLTMHYDEQRQMSELVEINLAIFKKQKMLSFDFHGHMSNDITGG